VEKQGAAEPTPGDYADYSLPDGYEIADADLLAFNGILGDLEHPPNQADAQRLIDLYVGIERNRGEFLEQLDAQETQARDAQWQEELQNDPDVGGDKMEAATANVVALEASGVLTPEFTQMLMDTGQIKNPAVIKQLSMLGQMIQEDPARLGVTHSGRSGPSKAMNMFSNSGHVD